MRKILRAVFARTISDQDIAGYARQIQSKVLRDADDFIVRDEG